MTKRARWDRGASSIALVWTGVAASSLLLGLACGAKSAVPPGAAAGGSRGIPDAGAGTSGTGFSGKAGAANAGASTGPLGGAAGQGGLGGAEPVGGAGQGGTAGNAGSAGQAGSVGMIDRGVVAAWADDRWVVVTPRDDSRALELYEVSEVGELLGGPREVELDQASVPLTLVDAARDPSTGSLGIIGDSAFITVSAGLEHALLSASVGPSECFVRRIEHVLELFVFVSVRRTLEGTTTVLETPGVIDGNPGFYQKELSWIRATDCRSLAFSPWENPDAGLGVDFVYPLRNLEGAPLHASRLYDRNKLTVGVGALRGLSAPLAPDFDGPTHLDLARSGARSVASFRDALQNGTRYLLIDEFAFTVMDEVVQHAPLRQAAPMKGDDEGFVQAVVVDDLPPRLELRVLWSGDAPYRSRVLAHAEVVAVHLARGPEGALAIALRVAPAPPNSSVGILPPGLYLFGTSRDEQVFRTQLPD